LTAKARGVDLIVLAGGSGRTLAFGPGHLGASALHRDTHFRFLRDVEPGELIRVETAAGRGHLYEVTSVEIVDSRTGSVLLDTQAAMMTLVTCYPFDAREAGGPLRYVVTARMKI
jgi:sortase A